MGRYMYAIDNMGDYRITAWEKMMADKYEVEFGSMNLNVNQFKAVVGWIHGAPVDYAGD